MNETDLLRLLIERTPYALPHVRVFRRNIINTQSIHGFRVRNGIAGQADAYAIVEGGRHVEIETKAARGSMREAQEAWQRWCRAWRVPHLVLRAARGEDPNETVKRWLDELEVVLA